ncbi:DinB family protein [Pseudooceanicola onchidii]|uniref:DinB family protein n=1 Tax=Pseudooceanicola onchidii TaxID=2562279 RepID=UPI001F0EDD87|nr:DinB family protein [Pseudooceanicola onchidii]
MSLITTDWVRMMARYNSWQNAAMARGMESLPAAALTEDRGAFFGSILATANHLLWGDLTWLARLDGGEGPGCSAAEGLRLCPTYAAWAAERHRVDARLTLYAKRLTRVDLEGNLQWYSGAAKAELSKPMALILTHFFNHQTHHRGQIHAMLTAAGVTTEATDLFLMPDL